MTAPPSLLATGWTRIDKLLGGLAVFGVILYVLVLPTQHPDAAASYTLGEAAAVESARVFLAETGYVIEEGDATISLRRQTTLLNALQKEFGRRETIRLLRDNEADGPIPAYYWRVQFMADTGQQERQTEFDVNLTSRGLVWSFDNRQTGSDGQASNRWVDRGALREVLTSPVSALGEEGMLGAADLGIFTDSLIVASFSFDSRDSLWHRDLATVQSLEASTTLAALRRYIEEHPTAALTVTLTPAEAVALARYHLDRTAWDANSFRLDSLWLARGSEGQVAHVRLARLEPLYGRQVHVDARVSVLGALQELNVTIIPDVAVQAISLGRVANFIKFALIGLFSLVLIVSFFRRLVARHIDLQSFLVDVIVFGLLAGALLALGNETLQNLSTNTSWLFLSRMLLIWLIGGLSAGLMLGLISGAGNALTRSIWEWKVRASSLVRLGSFRNIVVGAALVRGVGLGCVLLGVSAAGLVALPGARMSLTTPGFLPETSWQPALMSIARTGLFAYLMLALLLLGLGSFVYRYQDKALPVVGSIMGAMMLLQGPPLGFSPVEYTWIMAALLGGVLALAFWHYNFLTCFVGLFVVGILWELDEGWLIAGSPVLMDTLIAVLLVIGLLVLGVLGLVSGQEEELYIPAYITELKSQERLQSELDIARQVQESFLPHRLPDMPGLDIAALCLPALEVGGDYYDFVDVGPGKLAIVVGDVSGKGTQAAFYLTLTKGIVQTLSREGLSPAAVMRRLNRLFCANAPRGTFISMIYGVLDVEARTFIFARAGHNPLILKRSPNQESNLIKPAGMAIGFVTGPAFDETIEEQTINLGLGDVLVFYTDGISEAMNQLKDLYGDERLVRKVEGVGRRPATEILHAIAEDVHDFVESADRHDDMTMIVVKLSRTAAYASVASA